MVVLMITMCVIAGRYAATNMQTNSQGELFAQSTNKMQACFLRSCGENMPPTSDGTLWFFEPGIFMLNS